MDMYFLNSPQSFSHWDCATSVLFHFVLRKSGLIDDVQKRQHPLIAFSVILFCVFGFFNLPLKCIKKFVCQCEMS